MNVLGRLYYVRNTLILKESSSVTGRCGIIAPKLRPTQCKLWNIKKPSAYSPRSTTFLGWCIGRYALVLDSKELAWSKHEKYQNILIECLCQPLQKVWWKNSRGELTNENKIVLQPWLIAFSLTVRILGILITVGDRTDIVRWTE